MNSADVIPGSSRFSRSIKSWRSLDGNPNAIAPLYLFVCLIFGGSDRVSWRELVLDAAGIAVIVWAAMARADEPLARRARQVLVLAIVAIAMIALRALPLPYSFWAHGPGLNLANTFSLMGRGAAPTAMSVISYRPWSMLLATIPPLGIFCAIIVPGPSRPGWLLAGLLGGALVEIIGGALQVSAGASSHWYVYQDSRFAPSFGTFANRDHAADLFLVTLPFIAAIAAPSEHRDSEHQSGLLLISAALGSLMLVAIWLTGSSIGYVLAVPVLAMSALILIPSGITVRTPVALIAAVLTAAAIAGLMVGPELSGRTGHVQMIRNGEAPPSLSTSAKAVANSMPLGRGPGPISRVNGLNENSTGPVSDRLNNANSEFAEIALEFGVPGILLIGLFLVWWARAVHLAWRTDHAHPFVQAASIASGAILVHSLVDFPLRTTALSALFAMCVALLAERWRPQVPAPADFRPARHLVIHGLDDTR